MHIYHDLLTLAEAAEPWPKPTPEQLEADAFAAEQEICERLQIDVLGEWENGAVEIYSCVNRKIQQIRDIDRFGYSRFVQLCGRPAREYINQGMHDVPGMMKVGDVKAAIALLAGRTRLTHKSMLGVGCWRGRDLEENPRQETVLVGDGEAAAWVQSTKLLEQIEHPRRGGLLLGITGADGWYDFGRLSRDLEAAESTDWCTGVVDELADEFARWNWEHDTTPELLAGLVLASYVQTLWEWRPQVAITGRTNSGKSYLFETLTRIFGAIAYKVTGQSSTEAGIRQGLGSSAMVPLLDEWDKSRHREAILSMIRTAGRRDRRATGTQDQKGHETALQHIFWVAGIESGLRDEADSNRFIQIEAIPPKNGSRNKLQLRSESRLRDLGQRCLAVAVRHSLCAVKLASALKESPPEGCNARIAESYAVPAAMLACVSGLDVGGARKLLEQLLATVGEDSQPEADEAALLERIWMARIYAGKNLGTMSIAQLIDSSMGDLSYSASEDAANALGSVGIAISRYTEKDSAIMAGERCVVLAHRTVQEELLRNTDWAKRNIRQVLKRIDGVIFTKRRVGGAVLHSTLLPLSYLIDEETDEPGNTEHPQDGEGNTNESF